MDLNNPLRSLARPLGAEVLRALSATTSGRQVHQVSGTGSVGGDPLVVSWRS